ncbi:hypothetical protein [Anaeromicrobium sediminis]|uniref:hypothetical protein n=1 Tax=Anaeromicrobium sediminis TaxID=1478221 RepID=UPI0038BD6B9E
MNERKEKQIIICNTQSQQEEVYNQIVDKSPCIILNSKFTATDRARFEKEALDYFGKDSKNKVYNKILISHK